MTQLTFNGRNFFPTWSPDGKKIAWSISTGDSIMGLWTMNADSSNKKRLYPYGMMPDWLSNNASIVYIGPSVEGSSTSTSQIWIMDTLGNNKVRITNFNISNRYPKVSPTGTKIVFSSQAEGQGPRVWVVNTDGTNLIKLTETGGDHPAWSPDGTKIVYCNTVDGRLWTMNTDGTNKKQLSNRKDMIVKVTLIIFAVCLAIVGCGCNKTPTNPIDPPPIEPYATTDCDPSWSPNGNTIAYAHHSLSDTPSGIFLINPDGSNKRLFLESVEFQTLWHKPDWSPDGRWLVLCETYSAQIYKIMAPEGDSLT
ncbi:PD40 domain-containing protein, partial [candidate division TA06 bacterium]|nr:PD40 domain-containing protein [candidate division TA06 bacterium]